METTVLQEHPALVVRLVEFFGCERAFAVKWYRGGTDTRGIIPFALELSGRLVERRTFLGFQVTEYQLERPLPVVQLRSAFADFGILQLSGAFSDDEVPANDAIALALRTDSPIFVEEEVVNKAHSLKFDENLEDSEKLKKWLENLKPEDFGKYKM